MKNSLATPPMNETDHFGFPDFDSIAARRDVPLQLQALPKQRSVLELRANAIDERVAAIDRRLVSINERLAALNQTAPTPRVSVIAT